MLVARRRHRQGPTAGLAAGDARSTIYGVLARHRMSRLADTDRTSGVVVRYQRERPGELVHLDVKKLGRIPDGGGHRIHGRGAATPGRGIGYDYVHSAVDDRSRVAFSQILADESAMTAAQFLVETARFFAEHGVRIERVLTETPRPMSSRSSSPRPPLGWGSGASGPGRIGPRPMARSSGSTRPYSMSGPMSAVPLQCRALPRLGPVATVLQSPSTTHLARRPDPDDGPRQQRSREPQLGRLVCRPGGR